MTRIDGFQHEQLNPAIAAVLRADDSGEFPIVVVNTNQPHRAALDAVRAIKLHAVGGLFGFIHLFESLRRAPAEPMIVVAAAMLAALGGSVPLSTATPGQLENPAHIYMADGERKPLVRVAARPSSASGRRAHTATERRPTPTKSPRPEPSPQSTATPRAHPTPTPVPSYVFLDPLPTP